MDLKLRPKEECKFDEISLGEIMLRLDPGEGTDQDLPHLPCLGGRRRV